MELIIISWLCIAHIIYYVSLEPLTFDNTIQTNNEKYITALFWPYVIFIFLVQTLITGLHYVLRGFNWLEEYCEDIYWDIDCFHAFLLEMRKKP